MEYELLKQKWEISDIIIKKTNKLSLTVSSEGSVILTLPKSYKVTQKYIEEFILSKQKWLNKVKNRIQLYRQKYNELINYKQISILGKIYNIQYDSNLKTSFLQKDVLITKGYVYLIKYIKNIASEILIKRINQLSKLMQNIGDFYPIISNSKRYWGLCTTKKIIRLNYRLVMLPHNTIDYVLIHELAHLQQFNHSKAFWSIVEQYIPNFKEQQNYLKEYGFLLGMYHLKK